MAVSWVAAVAVKWQGNGRGSVGIEEGEASVDGDARLQILEPGSAPAYRCK